MLPTIAHNTTLFTNDAIGVKCISSPKQPHDSMLPSMVGKKAFTMVNHTKNIRSKNMPHNAMCLYFVFNTSKPNINSN